MVLGAIIVLTIPASKVNR